MAADEWSGRPRLRHLPGWLADRWRLATKRRIIALHTETLAGEFEGKPDTVTWCPICTNHGECPTIMLLALPYASHDEYQEAWKP